MYKVLLEVNIQNRKFKRFELFAKRFELFAKTFSLLGLTCFNSMLELLVVQFYLSSCTYLYQLIFFFKLFFGNFQIFSIQFSNIISKASNFYNEKKLNQEESKSTKHNWQDAKNISFQFTCYYLTIYSVKVTKGFITCSHTILV